MTEESKAEERSGHEAPPPPGGEVVPLPDRLREWGSRLVGWLDVHRRRPKSIALAVVLVLTAWLGWTVARWPDVKALRTRNPATTAFIERYRSLERDEGRAGDVAWSPVPYDRITPNLKRSVVASEDTEFFFHDGFSSHEMRVAIMKAIREWEAPRGASTITQQLAKNLWLTPSRSLTRKLREALLTRQLEKHLSKERILDLYLNVVEFGPGIYGAEAASRHYFGVPASGLSPRQGAMLAAGLPRPKTWNPESGSEAYARRVERILGIQQQLEFLDRYVGAVTPGQVVVEPPGTEGITAPVAVAPDSL